MIPLFSLSDAFLSILGINKFLFLYFWKCFQGRFVEYQLKRCEKYGPEFSAYVRVVSNSP